MHDICPHPLQIILPYVLLKIIGNKNSGLIIARGVYENKMGISLSVVTHAATEEHCYTDSFSYYLLWKGNPLTVFHILCIEASASFSLSQVAVWVEGKIDFADNTFTVNDIRYPWRIHV